MKNTTARSAFTAGARTPEQILAFHRRIFGDVRMEASQDSEQKATEKPEGVSEAEWEALGDPGKQALIRERQARADLEAQLAEARKPKPTPPAQKQVEPQGGEKTASQDDDIEARIAAAVQAALAPVQEAQTQWQAEQLANRVRETVATTAAARFHDASDVVPHLDLTQLTDGSGAPDQTKIAAELDRIASEKPHLVKPTYTPRTPMPGAPFGGSATTSIDDRVKESLSRMQKVTGTRSAGTV